MKQLIFTLALLMVGMTASAQKIIDRNMTLSGDVAGLFKKAKPVESDLITYESGTMWYLRNDVIGKDNYIRFWIETPDGRNNEICTWHEHGVVIIDVSDKEKKCYFVLDDDYQYAVVVEVQPEQYVIKLHTEAR